jgi:hypothetical protein
MIKAILTTFVAFLAFVMVLAFGYMAGHYNAIDQVNSWIKAEVPVAQPEYTPTKYLRYGGGEGFKDQMNRIKFEGQKELVTAWDQKRFWPWDALVAAVKDWRE